MAVIFMHIPKNGGKTLNSILNRFYPQEKTFAITEITPYESNLKNFYQIPAEQKAKLELLRGHMSFGLHEYFPNETKYFTILRRPEERVLSFYHFVLRQPQHRLYKEAKNLKFLDFVQKVNPPDLNNGQIRFISGISDKEEFMLEKALENIEKHFALVGTLEKFDEVLLFLKNLYSWPYPFYTIRNKNQNNTKIEALPIDAQQIIAEYNRGDKKLYDEISVRIENKIQNTPDFKNDVKIFKVLNELYSIPLGKKIIKKVLRTDAFK